MQSGSKAPMPGAALNRRGHPTTPGTQSSSATNATPLKFPKQTTAYALSPSLVGGQKGGALLARRSSASFNHVRTSSLVSSSPFKTGEDASSTQSAAKERPQRDLPASQHVATRSFLRRSVVSDHKILPQTHLRAKSDENKYAEHIRKPRESKGFQELSSSEVVTKSPFVEANGPRPPPRHAYTRSEDFSHDFSGTFEAPGMVKSATYPSVAIDRYDSPRSTPVSSRPSSSTNSPVSLTPSRPLPGTPQRPAMSPAQASPRSNLVSKRLIGPRSPEDPHRSSSDTPIKRQRRKTVTWDEKCDVVEFDQEEEEQVEFAVDTEDSKGSEEMEHEQEQEVEQEHQQLQGTGEDYYGPNRESGRSPSPILSGSLADTADDPEDFESKSINSLSTNNGTVTPQLETQDLPQENDFNYPNAFDPPTEAHLAGIANNSMFSGNNSSFRDSTSTIDDSFTRRLKEEPDVETSLRFSESRSPERFPRISRDNVRRQIEQQRLDSDSFLDSHETRSRLSMGSIRDDGHHSGSNSPFNRMSLSGASPAHKADELFNSTFKGNGPDVNLEDVHSALDRLMLGVEKGFEPSICSNASEIDVEEDPIQDVSFAPEHYGKPPADTKHMEHSVEMEQTDSLDLPMLRESTVMSGTSTETTEGPYTPQLHTSALVEPTPAKDLDHSTSKPLPPPPEASPPPSVHASLHIDTNISRAPSPLLSAPANPPTRGNTIKRREEAIKAKRRELRAAEGRPSRRRSQSTGDLKAKYGDKEEPEELTLPQDGVGLSDAFQHEVAKLNPSKKTYMMKQRRPTIYASDSKVGHMSNAGDVHGVKAWRAVRRPSDMNEYSRQIRQLRNQEKGANGNGKVFVKVIGIKDLNIPLPAPATYFTCVLNNGIHFVETPASRLEQESLIDQEFELIEHEKLEFTLTIKVRRDPHITKLMNPAPRPLSVPARLETPTKTKGGMRSFFSSPAKKASKSVPPPQETILPPVESTDPFGRYLKKDLSIARALVSFKDVVTRCDMKLFETSYPLIGQQSNGPEVETKTVGEIVLQMFRLPSLPGIPQTDLPQSLDECQRGLRHVHWHKVVYHEGLLTQLGGDCTTWRRRHLQVMGANLIAYNDVTKKPITTMDLRKVTLVEDEPRHGVPATIIQPPAVAVAEDSLQAPKTLRRQRSFNALQGIDHSFRVVFEDDENDDVCFFADTAEEKKRWLEIFGALVGRIPHNPLWAELLWQKQQEQESA